MALDVLIVDDSHSVRKILLRMMRETKLPLGQCYEAGDGVEAIQVLEAHPIGLVLTDINMPNMDGLALLDEIKQNPRLTALPVLVISTESGMANMSEAVKRGAAGFVRKPFDCDTLRQKLLTVMASS